MFTGPNISEHIASRCGDPGEISVSLASGACGYQGHMPTSRRILYTKSDSGCIFVGPHGERIILRLHDRVLGITRHQCCEFS